MAEILSGDLKTNEYTIIHHSREFIKIFNGLAHPISVEFAGDDIDTIITIRPTSRGET